MSRLEGLDTAEAFTLLVCVRVSTAVIHCESRGHGWTVHCTRLFPSLQHHLRQLTLHLLWAGGRRAAPDAGHIQ